MSNFIAVSRSLCLGTAFVGVMTFAGGLFGAVSGMILALLSRALMNLSGDIYGLVIVCVALGAVAFLITGIALLAPQALHVSFRARSVQAMPSISAVPANSESN